MSQSFSVQDALRQSATDVDIDELTRRGLRKVKVLDKATVFRLIDEAVNRVVEERLQAATQQEREQIQQQARAEFQTLVKQHQSQVQEQLDRTVEEYQLRIKELETQVTEGAVPGATGIDKEMLGAMIREAVAGASPQGEGGGGDLSALQKSIESLSRKVSAASGKDVVEAPSEEALTALFSRTSDAGVETNLTNVEVKNAKAGGVNKNLAKLRSLKKGSE
jgi:replicative DNA helicase